MKTATYPLCDKCSTPILRAENGYIIQGNIYTSQLNDSGESDRGLIGNNIEEKEGVIIEVRKTCMCKPCFFKAIGIQSTTR